MRLVLHPGHGKCGSSSIQSFLYSNQDELERLGAWVSGENLVFRFEANPSFKEIPPLAYFERFSGPKADMQSFRARLDEILEKATQNNCKLLIMSAENLSAAERFSEIHRTLASYFNERTIIYYIRKQDDYLISAWQQWGHKEGLDLQAYIENSLANHYPRLLNKARQLREIYGEDNISVVPLHKKALKEGDLITDFCHRAQLDFLGDTRVRSNRGLNLYLCDILSRISNVYKSRGDNSIRHLLERYVDADDLLFFSDKQILSRGQRDLILEHYEDDNRALSQEFFADLSYEEFVSNETYATEESRQRPEHELEMLKDVIAIQMEIIVKLMQQQPPPSSRPRLKRTLRAAVRRIFPTE